MMSDTPVQLKQKALERPLECSLDDLVSIDPVGEFYDYDQGLCLEPQPKAPDVDHKKAIRNKAKAFKSEESKQKKLEPAVPGPAVPESGEEKHSAASSSEVVRGVAVPTEIHLTATALESSAVLFSQDGIDLRAVRVSLAAVDVSTAIYFGDGIEPQAPFEKASAKSMESGCSEREREVESSPIPQSLGAWVMMGERITDPLIEPQVCAEPAVPEPQRGVDLKACVSETVRQTPIERKGEESPEIVAQRAPEAGEFVKPLPIGFHAEISASRYVGGEVEWRGGFAVFHLEQSAITETVSQVLIVLPPGWVSPKERIGGAGVVSFDGGEPKSSHTKIERRSSSQSSSDGNQTGHHGGGQKQNERRYQ